MKIHDNICRASLVGSAIFLWKQIETGIIGSKKSNGEMNDAKKITYCI